MRPMPITLRPNIVPLDTGRASYSDVIQQLPRSGGVRDCFVPRPGKVFFSCDYTGLELATHAQSCLWILGESKLAEALNKGIKVHDALAATMCGKPYEEFIKLVKAGDKTAKNLRQAAKPANFGFPGGMGEVKLVQQQRKGGPNTACPNGPTVIDHKGTRGYKGLRFCILMDNAERCGDVKITSYKDNTIPPTCKRCIECARDLRAKWFMQWPENRPYFAFISKCMEDGQRYRDQNGVSRNLKPRQIMQHHSKRLRGATDFCSAANGYFQGLAADGAKLALTRVSRECYDATFRLVDGTPSPLFGTRVILYAHDELFGETDEPTLHESMLRLSAVMCESMRTVCPDVAIEAPAAAARRWYKGMEPQFDSNGRLVPWDPPS